MTSVSKLAWLQDTPTDAVWGKWDVEYRDVKIVDAEGRLAGVYNLTEHNLADEYNQEALKAMLLKMAKAVDTDEDRLPDAWERYYFGNLNPRPEEDPDGDGVSNLAELAFGTAPNDPKSNSGLRTELAIHSGQKVVKFILRRPSGALFRHDVLWRKALQGGSSFSVNAGSGTVQNLFDGSGSSEVSWSLSGDSEPTLFLQAQALPRP